MHALFLALVAYAGPNDYQWDQKRPDDPIWANVAVPTARLSQRLQGRVLGALIQDGMSKGQVDFLLGTHRSTLVVAFGGAVSASDYSYRRLGIGILYIDGRVAHVRFFSSY